ncbi:metallopeptidase family protein [Corynebacterium sp. L4756]|uniref:metallopeptidase family protein n=1 Tax=unclassified Corynebacterium TaxID=2624378 RepID=UPI00374DB7BE
MVQVSEERFDEMVNDALDKIPDEFVDKMRNMVILVRDFNEDNPEILGLYEGVALTDRTHHHTGFLPDAIFIYRGALQNMCSSEEELAHEVEVTVFHELGHYFGFEEEDLHRLGWG